MGQMTDRKDEDLHRTRAGRVESFIGPTNANNNRTASNKARASYVDPRIIGCERAPITNPLSKHQRQQHLQTTSGAYDVGITTMLQQNAKQRIHQSISHQTMAHDAVVSIAVSSVMKCQSVCAEFLWFNTSTSRKSQRSQRITKAMIRPSNNCKQDVRALQASHKIINECKSDLAQLDIKVNTLMTFKSSAEPQLKSATALCTSFQAFLDQEWQPHCRKFQSFLDDEWSQ